MRKRSSINDRHYRSSATIRAFIWNIEIWNGFRLPFNRILYSLNSMGAEMSLHWVSRSLPQKILHNSRHVSKFWCCALNFYATLVSDLCPNQARISVQLIFCCRCAENATQNCMHSLHYASRILSPVNYLMDFVVARPCLPNKLSVGWIKQFRLFIIQLNS